MSKLIQKDAADFRTSGHLRKCRNLFSSFESIQFDIIQIDILDLSGENISFSKLTLSIELKIF